MFPYHFSRMTWSNGSRTHSTRTFRALTTKRKSDRFICRTSSWNISKTIWKRLVIFRKLIFKELIYFLQISEAAPLKRITPRPAKTDIEIIVNNPDYGDHSKLRPGSNRHQLLHDLEHTNLSQMVNNDGIGERNKINAEVSWFGISKNFWRIV